MLHVLKTSIGPLEFILNIINYYNQPYAQVVPMSDCYLYHKHHVSIYTFCILFDK